MALGWLTCLVSPYPIPFGDAAEVGRRLVSLSTSWGCRFQPWLVGKAETCQRRGSMLSRVDSRVLQRLVASTRRSGLEGPLTIPLSMGGPLCPPVWMDGA